MLQLVYVGAVVVAVVFTLARHRWGSVLGAGLCVVHVVVLAVNVAQLFGLGGRTPFSDDPNLVSLGVYLALQVVPSLVAFWLFTRPYVAGWPQEGASTRP